jgi:hypothetical protein
MLPLLGCLHQQIKHLDQLTYRYAFEKEREEFEPSATLTIDNDRTVPVHWIMLHLDPTTISQRISQREELSIF